MKILPSPDNVQARVLETNHAILALRTGDMRSAQEWSERLEARDESPRQSMNAMRDAIQLFLALEQGRLQRAVELGESLSRVDLSFPFDSNLAIVPEALAELRRRLGQKRAGRQLLEKAAETMGRFNAPCRRQILARLGCRIWQSD